MAYLNHGSVFGELSRTAEFAERLDSSLRRAATGLLPSRRIQDFLSINDGEEKTGRVAIPIAPPSSRQACA